jgi:hypothetical protein
MNVDALSEVDSSCTTLSDWNDCLGMSAVAAFLVVCQWSMIKLCSNNTGLHCSLEAASSACTT